MLEPTSQVLEEDPLLELSMSEQSKLTCLQQSLVQQGMWNDGKHDLHMLRRFLKARQWDVAGAQQMWMEMLQFRALNNVDRILTDFHFHEREAFLDVYPHGLHKVDKKFRPVIVYKLGSVDLDRLKTVTTDERLTLYHIQEYERMMHGVLPACRLVSGRYVEQMFTLIDVGGLKMKDMMRVKDLMIGYIKVDSINYPETLGAMVIINAPYWFTGMFSAVKSFLPPDTQKKVQILGSNYHKELLKMIDPENLLVEYGGKSTGSLRDNIGPWKPVLESLKEGTEARQQALDRDLPEDTEEVEATHAEWEQGWEQQRSSKRQRSLVAHALGPDALPEGVLQPDGSLRPYHTEHEVAFVCEAGAHEHKGVGASGRAHSGGYHYTNSSMAVHACTASRASSATPPPADGGALLPQPSIAHSCQSTGSTTLSPSPLQGGVDPLTGLPLQASQNGHSHHHRHRHRRHHHRHYRNSHNKGPSPLHSSIQSTHSSTVSPQQENSAYTDHSQQATSVPELPFSNSPDHAPSMFAGPFGSHLTQRAAIEACMSWDAVTASGNSIQPMNSIALSCYHSLDTEATSALRPTTPSASHQPHLPVWQEDDPENSPSPSSPNAHHTHPLTPPPHPPLNSLCTSAHSVQPYNTSPFSPQPSTAHNALSATPTAADAYAHTDVYAHTGANSALPSASLLATHQQQFQMPIQTQAPRTSSSWQRPRRSIDTQLPPDHRWLDAQAHRGPRNQSRRSSEWPNARSHAASRGSSMDGGIGAGPRLPTVQTGLLWPVNQVHSTHPLPTSLSRTTSQGLPYTGVHDTDAVTEAALATMRATTRASGYVTTRPSTVNSGIYGASMCSACSETSDSVWMPSTDNPNKGATSPPFPGSASPSQSYVSVGGLRPSTGGLSSPAHSVAPGLRASMGNASSLSPAHSANPRDLLPASSLHHTHSPPSAVTSLRPYGSGPLQGHALLPQGSLGAPRHPTSRPSEAPSHDFARMSFHSAGSMDSNSLQFALNTLGGGSGPGGTPIAATNSFPWLDPPAAAASAANMHPHTHPHPHHPFGNGSCRASGTGGNQENNNHGGGTTPVLGKLGAHLEVLRGRSITGGPQSPGAAFSMGQEEQGARPPSRMFSLPHQRAEQAHASRTLQNSSSAGAGPASSPASRLSSFAHSLRMNRWFSKGKENREEERKDSSSFSKPLLVLQSQQNSQQRQSKGEKGTKQNKRDKDGTARTSYKNVTSNPLVEEGVGDSDKATEWEWEDVKEQDTPEKGRGNITAAHARGVTWAALPASRVDNEGEEENQRQPLKGCRSRSFGSALSDISPRQSHSQGHNRQSHQQHTKKRSSRSAAHNTVLPMGCDSSTVGWDEHSPGTSNFGSRRTSKRNSRPSAYQGPRCSSTSWYGSCEDTEGWVLEEKPTVVEDDEGEEGGLLGGGAVARKHSRGQKKPGFAKKLAKKLFPCCGIQ